MNSLLVLLCVVLGLSPVLRFTWDLWPQVLMHLLVTGTTTAFLLARRPAPGRRFHGALLLFFAAALCSLPGSTNLANVRNELLVLCDAVQVGFLVSFLAPGQKRKLFLVPALAGLFFTVLLSVLTARSFLGAPLPPDTFVNFNVLAGYLALCFPLSFLLWEDRRREGILLSALILIGIILTRSRAAVFFSFGTLAVFLLASRAGSPGRRQLLLLAPPVIALLYVLTRYKGGLESLLERLMWAKSAWRLFTLHPLFGAGWGNFGDLFLSVKAGPGLNTLYAHDLFLQVLAEAGLAGFAALCALLAAFFLRGADPHAERDRRLSLPLTLAAGSFLALNLFDYSFFIPGVMLLFFACLGGGFHFPSEKRESLPGIRALLPLGAGGAMLAWLLVTPLLASIHYRHALYALAHRLPREAEEELAQALAFDPLPYQYYRARAEACVMAFDRERDPEYLQKAITLQAEAVRRFTAGARLWSDLAWLYLSAGMRDNAVLAMRKAVELDPYNRAYPRNLALFESGQGPGAGPSSPLNGGSHVQ